VWALANLTTVTPDKYCSLVQQEGGLDMVEEMLNENSDQVKTSLDQVRDLARTVRTNVIRWREQGNLDLEYDG